MPVLGHTTNDLTVLQAATERSGLLSHYTDINLSGVVGAGLLCVQQSTSTFETEKPEALTSVLSALFCQI